MRSKEVSRLLDDCVKDDRAQGLRDAALLALLYGCGLRRAEVVGIDIEDLDRADGSVRIRGKGNKERRVYPPPRAWELIHAWLREARTTHGPVFRRIRKQDVITRHRLSGDGVYYLINQFAARTGIVRITPHDLRAAFISYLLDQGEDIKRVAPPAGVD